MNRFRLIVLLFLSFLSFNSFSAVSTVTIYKTYHPYSGHAYSGSTPEEACHAAGAAQNGKYVSWKPETPLKCFYLSKENSIVQYTYPITSSSSCPENSTLSGSQCVCNEGYEEKNGNSCVLPEPPDTCKEIESTCSIFKN